MPNDRRTPTVDLRDLARETSRETVKEMPAASGAPASFQISLAAIPLVVVPPEELIALPLDARFGFLLSLMDGATTVEELLDVATIDRADVLEMLGQLLQQGVIALRNPSRSE
jgi:hypothetical protein